MHAGRVLAVGTPHEIRAAKQGATLEEAFIAYLEEAGGGASAPAGEGAAAPVHVAMGATAPPAAPRAGVPASFARIWAFARREALELVRDRVRLAFALLGPLILLVTFGYGISFDVENLPFAVFDRDQSAESRDLIESFAGSRYFTRRPALASEVELDRRLRSGELRLAIDIPPSFGRDLLNGRRPEVAFFVDGAHAFRAETVRSYVQGIMLAYAQDQARRTSGGVSAFMPVRLEPRFRYNQDFRSVFAITPGVIMILLIFIPSMLTALGVVREREIGSISNLYASPASVGEFLLGKQLPYIVLGFVSFLSMVALADVQFGVAVKGSSAALALAALLYVAAGTGLGILISTFVRPRSRRSLPPRSSARFRRSISPAISIPPRRSRVPAASSAWDFRRSGFRT